MALPTCRAWLSALAGVDQIQTVQSPTHRATPQEWPRPSRLDTVQPWASAKSRTSSICFLGCRTRPTMLVTIQHRWQDYNSDLRGAVGGCGALKKRPTMGPILCNVRRYPAMELRVHAGDPLGSVNLLGGALSQSRHLQPGPKVAHGSSGSSGEQDKPSLTSLGGLDY
jgi:hypothetical protein